jgi:peptidyl-tRNA hydrolase, PTH1 family
MGIAPEHPVRDGARYVLAQFKKSQLEAVDQLLDTAADAVTAIVTEGAQAAMNRFNRKEPPKESGAEAGT